MKQLTQLILFIFLFQFQANAQFWKKAKEVVENVGDKISLKSLQSDPVSTSFSDVDRQNTMAISFGADANYAFIHEQPFSEANGFYLQPGFYEAEFDSFCIKAGTYAPTSGSGRFFAPLEGPKADIFETILTAFQEGRVEKQDAQLLFWAIIAKTDFEKMEGRVKATAVRILSTEELARLSTNALQAYGKKQLNKLSYKSKAARAIIDAENKLRSKYYNAVNSYAEYEEIAMLAGVEPVVSGWESGKWTKHPDGYYLRYYPSGYQKTRTQVYVPEDVGDIFFDAFGDVAVPAHTSSQRLLQSNSPYGVNEWPNEETVYEEDEVDEDEADEDNEVTEESDEEENDSASSPKKLPCKIENDMVLVNTRMEVDYFIDCVLDLTAKLTIEPGVIIEFGENAGLGVYDQGKLQIEGNENEQVVLRGAYKTAGYWRGIHIENDSKLEHAIIQHAGSNYVYCCREPSSIFARQCNLEITNTKIESGSGCGIFVGNDLNLTTDQLTILNHEGEDYCYSGPETITQKQDQPRVLKNSPRPVDYKVREGVVVDVTSTLTIEPGVVIEFGEDAGLGVYDQGSLQVLGNAGDKVILRGEQPQAGYWRGIHLESDSRIEHAIIQHTGSSYVYCCFDPAAIFLRKGNFTIKNTDINSSTGCGIYQRSSATLEVDNNSFYNNSQGNICSD